MGIDYGSKRVGIALSDENGRLAFPCEIIKNSPGMIEEISNLCTTKNVTAIVLGESMDLAGKPNKIMGSIETFKRNLELAVSLPVEFLKEFMTTIAARGFAGKESMNARQVKKEHGESVDASAAALILQRYLDKKNQK